MLNDKIKDQRRGSITASEANSIMTGWDAPRPTEKFEGEIYDWIAHTDRKPSVSEINPVMDCNVSGKAIDAAWKAYRFGKPPQGLITYAETLAVEELFEPDPTIEDRPISQHMENGNDREVTAMEKLSGATGLDFAKTGDDQIHISVNGIGATPDGIVYDELDLIHAGAECKARSALHHARELFITDNATLIEYDFARYCQIQVGYEVTGASEWYSISYNPFAIDKADGFHYCLIERDESFLKIFRQRAALVFKHKQMFIESIIAGRDVRAKQSLKVAA